jgi:hypothetical protein
MRWLPTVQIVRVREALVTEPHAGCVYRAGDPRVPFVASLCALVDHRDLPRGRASTGSSLEKGEREIERMKQQSSNGYFASSTAGFHRSR